MKGTNLPSTLTSTFRNIALLTHFLRQRFFFVSKSSFKFYRIHVEVFFKCFRRFSMTAASVSGPRDEDFCLRGCEEKWILTNARGTTCQRTNRRKKMTFGIRLLGRATKIETETSDLSSWCQFTVAVLNLFIDKRDPWTDSQQGWVHGTHFCEVEK